MKKNASIGCLGLLLIFSVFLSLSAYHLENSFFSECSIRNIIVSSKAVAIYLDQSAQPVEMPESLSINKTWGRCFLLLFHSH